MLKKQKMRTTTAISMAYTWLIHKEKLQKKEQCITNSKNAENSKTQICMLRAVLSGERSKLFPLYYFYISAQLLMLRAATVSNGSQKPREREWARVCDLDQAFLCAQHAYFSTDKHLVNGFTFC